MRRRESQLYTLASEDFRMPKLITESGYLVEKAADNFPIMQWPDGSWCHDANTYLRELFERNLSRRNRGGSLMVVAAHITHLIRFCWKCNTNLIELSDNQFTLYMKELFEEPRRGYPDQRARDANTVLAIGRDCLGLLRSVGRKHGEPNFVGPTGRIRIEAREYVVRGDEGDDVAMTRRLLHHASFPQPAPKKRRLPVESKAIDGMRDAVSRVSRSPHQRARRRCLLLLFEITGARRGEVAELEIAAVRRAVAMEHPTLRLITLKTRQQDPPYRFVPISKADALALLNYIEVYRRGVVRRAWNQSDHGKVLVSIRTGAPLRPNTITQEIKRLAKASGITEKVCAHMFRHRFITKLFVALIERHKIENVDEFRRALLSTETLKREVLEWTGQRSIKALERYIHLAFHEIAEYKKTCDGVRVTSAVDSFAAVLKDEINRLDEDSDVKGAARRIQNLAQALREDLLRLLQLPRAG